MWLKITGSDVRVPGLVSAVGFRLKRACGKMNGDVQTLSRGSLYTGHPFFLSLFLSFSFLLSFFFPHLHLYDFTQRGTV